MKRPTVPQQPEEPETDCDHPSIPVADLFAHRRPELERLTVARTVRRRSWVNRWRNHDRTSDQG